jgi:hypothetical protein
MSDSNLEQKETVPSVRSRTEICERGEFFSVLITVYLYSGSPVDRRKGEIFI